MEAILPLNRMSSADKLRAMEAIWDDLQHTTPTEIPPPAWHADVLRAREQRVAAKTARFSDWSEAKVRIRGQAAKKS